MACWLGDDCWAASQCSRRDADWSRAVLERPLPADIALAGRQLAQHVRQVVAQDRAQPCRGLGLGSRSPRRVVIEPLVGFQKRLLDDPREIDLVAQPRSDLEPGQEPQVGAKPLQVLGLELRGCRRRGTVTSRSVLPGLAPWESKMAEIRGSSPAFILPVRGRRCRGIRSLLDLGAVLGSWPASRADQCGSASLGLPCPSRRNARNK